MPSIYNQFPPDTELFIPPIFKNKNEQKKVQWKKKGRTSMSVNPSPAVGDAPALSPCHSSVETVCVYVEAERGCCAVNDRHVYPAHTFACRLACAFCRNQWKSTLLSSHAAQQPLSSYTELFSLYLSLSFSLNQLLSNRVTLLCPGTWEDTAIYKIEEQLN